MPFYTEPSSLFLGFLLSAGLNLKTLLLLHAGITGMNHTFHLSLTLVINQVLWFILPYTMDNLAFPPPSKSQSSFPPDCSELHVCVNVHTWTAYTCVGAHTEYCFSSLFLLLLVRAQLRLPLCSHSTQAFYLLGKQLHFEGFTQNEQIFPLLSVGELSKGQLH